MIGSAFDLAQLSANVQDWMAKHAGQPIPSHGNTGLGIPLAPGAGPETTGQPADDMSGMQMGGSMYQPPSDTGVKGAEQNMMSVLGKPQTMTPMPGQTNPAYRSQDAIKLLIGGLLSAALGGHQSNQSLQGFLGGYAGAKQKGADEATQRATQEWQMGNQQQQMNRQQELQVASQGLNNANADYSRAWSAQQALQKMADERMFKAQTFLGSLETRVQNAKSFQQLKNVRNQIFNIAFHNGLPADKPTDADLIAEWSQVSSLQKERIQRQWIQDLGSYTSGNYGEVRDIDASKAESHRQALIKQGQQYDPNFDLPQLPSPSSLKAGYMKTRQAELEAKMKNADQHMQSFLKMNDARISNLQSEIWYRAQRIPQMGYGLDTARMNAETNQLRLQLAKEVESKRQDVLSRLGSDKTGLSAKYKTLYAAASAPGATKAIQNAAVNAKANLDALSARLDELNALKAANGDGSTVKTTEDVGKHYQMATDAIKAANGNATAIAQIKADYRAKTGVDYPG